jgi:hypothetical protein
MWKLGRPKQCSASNVIKDSWGGGRAPPRIEGNPQHDPSDPALKGAFATKLGSMRERESESFLHHFACGVNTPGDRRGHPAERDVVVPINLLDLGF